MSEKFPGEGVLILNLLQERVSLKDFDDLLWSDLSGMLLLLLEVSNYLFKLVQSNLAKLEVILHRGDFPGLTWVVTIADPVALEFKFSVVVISLG